MNVIVNGAYIKRKLRLRVEGVKNVPAYEATHERAFHVWRCPIGRDKIPLLVDPQDPQRFEYDDSENASDSASGDSYRPRTTIGNRGRRLRNVADQLGKLATLHQQGVLSDDEFSAAKRKLLA